MTGQKNLTDERMEFKFYPGIFSYRLTKPTNYFITNNSFGAVEICNNYLYSKDGEELFDYDCDTIDHTAGILFWDSNKYCDPENPEMINKYVEHRKAGKAIVEKKDEKYLKYRVHGESSLAYYDNHIYQLTQYADFSIELRINKQNLNKEQIKNVINEYYAIINTLEIRIDENDW